MLTFLFLVCLTAATVLFVAMAADVAMRLHSQ